MTTEKIIEIIEENKIQKMKEFDVLIAKAKTLKLKNLAIEIPVILEITKTEKYDLEILVTLLKENFNTDFFKKANYETVKNEVIIFDENFEIRLNPYRREILLKDLKAKHIRKPTEKIDKHVLSESYQKFLKEIETYVNKPNLTNLLKLTKSNYERTDINIREIMAVKKDFSKTAGQMYLEKARKEIEEAKKRKEELILANKEYEEERILREIFIKEIKKDLKPFIFSDIWYLTEYNLKQFVTDSYC